MEGPAGMVHTTKKIQKKIATNYYKDLLKYEDRPNIELGEMFFPQEDRVCEEENRDLEEPFCENEIKTAVFGSYSDGAPGADGLSFMFYQKYWDVVKGDLVKMFESFHQGRLPIRRINFANISLIPKENGACTTKIFKTISLLNCSYKIFTKVLTNRINRVTDRLICRNQTSFIKGRYILESVVSAHEIIHSVYQSGEPGVVLKLYYEKAYDKVNWDFLLEVLEKRDFRTKWISWIRNILYNGFVGITVNNSEGNHFCTGKGLRQGDPPLPYYVQPCGRCAH